LRTAIITASLVALLGAFALAVPAEVTLSEPNIFPESITSTADGAVYVGSLVQPFISRALPGETTAKPWIRFTGDQVGSTLGVLADSANRTLWACVIEHPATTPQPPSPNARHTSLRSFDLATGAFRQRWPLPGEFNSCNDMTVMADRTVYISDPSNGRVLRLKPGAAAIDVFIKEDRLNGVDGIAVMNGALYVNSISSGKVYRVPMDATGNAGPLVEIALSRPLQSPDGMRALGTRMYVAESRPMQVSMMVFDGDTATVTTIKGGYKNPTAVSPTGDTLWIGESKQNYWRDPALASQSPNPFVIYSIPLPK
jgi:hypothetical protein